MISHTLTRDSYLNVLKYLGELWSGDWNDARDYWIATKNLEASSADRIEWIYNDRL